MPFDQEFERIVGWFARHKGEVDHVHAGLTTPEAALARAEYELQQVRRDLAEVMLKPLVPGRVL